MKIFNVWVVSLCTIFSLTAQSSFKTIIPVQETGEIKSFKNSRHLLKTTKAFSHQEEAVHFTQQSFYTPVFGLDVVKGEDQRALFISTNKDYNYPKSQSLEAQTVSFLEASSTLLGIEDAGEAFEEVSRNYDEHGGTHIKMQQLYKGVEVYGGEVILHAKNNLIQSLNGHYLEEPKSIEIKASIPLDKAKEQLIDKVGIAEVKEDPFGLFNFEKLHSKLVIYTDEEGHQHLAYHHTIYKTVIDRWEYFTDAHTGEEIHGHSSICQFHNHHDEEAETKASPPPPDGPVVSNATDLFGTSQTINSYNVSDVFYMIDASREMYRGASSSMPDEPVGVIWTIDAFNTSIENDNFKYDHVKSSGNTFSGKQTAVSAHVNGGVAYDYFRNVHNRNAINGSGGNIISLINITDKNGNDFDNAFWNGQAMFYGNGSSIFRPLARGLDVAGHEMTHGVVQATANLQYQGESGALNESFADVFGAMMDRDDWVIGEDVVLSSAFPSGALRSLIDPHNGAATNDFNGGWQPKHVNEQFRGSQDNGGVHINSGIANHAFYLFANQIGREKAEKVYYHALTNYMTKSSQFVDARIAIVQSATDLYGQAEIDAAKNAWSAVGVGEGSGGDYETDVEVNPGQDFIVYTDETSSKLSLARGDGGVIQEELNSVGPISRPSVSDDGSIIVYAGRDNQIHLVSIDWQNGTFQNSVFDNQPVWRNAIVSKDGRKIAASTTNNDNKIYVYDAVLDQTVTFDLFNPTFTQGVNAGNVLYSDAMEFDITGQYILYDALNLIDGTTGDIRFWDIGVIEVWNNANDGFALGEIEKVFTGLQEGESVGNPTFSKNSDYIIAFDYVRNGSIFNLLAANIERGDIGLLFENGGPSYPSYSTKDDKVIHNLTLFGGTDLGILDVSDSKILTIPNSEDILIGQSRLGVWFSNGQRELVDIDELHPSQEHFTIAPNPSSQSTLLSIEMDRGVDAKIQVMDLQGKVHSATQVALTSGMNHQEIDLSELPVGLYLVSVSTPSGVLSQKVMKVD